MCFCFHEDKTTSDEISENMKGRLGCLIALNTIARQLTSIDFNINKWGTNTRNVVGLVVDLGDHSLVLAGNVHCRLDDRDNE